MVLHYGHLDATERRLIMRHRDAGKSLRAIGHILGAQLQLSCGRSGVTNAPGLMNPPMPSAKLRGVKRWHGSRASCITAGNCAILCMTA